MEQVLARTTNYGIDNSTAKVSFLFKVGILECMVLECFEIFEMK